MSAAFSIPDTRVFDVARALAMRSLRAIRRMPAAFIPSLVMPIFLVIAFSGAFAAITELPLFPTRDALAWFVPQAALQGASFGGMGVAFGAVRDIETGFFDRLVMSPAPRRALLLGPVASGVVRAILPLAIVTIVGFIGGMNMPGGPLSLLTLTIAGIGMALMCSGLGLGLAYRVRSMAGAALTQFVIFVALFLSEAQMPASLTTGWLKPISTHSPATHIQRLARAGFLGDVTWSVVWPGLAWIVALSVIAVAFAARGLERIVR